jgi:hypothetical protein
VKDCKKPTIVCINGLAVNLMNSAPPMVQLWASDFLQYTEDNCTPDNLVKVGIRRVGQADGQGNTTGFPKNADGTPQTGVSFTCADLGTQLVELWGLDLAGNADYCETYVLIQDNMGLCGTNATIAGSLKTEEIEGIEDVTVELDGSSNGTPVLSEVFSQVSGDYIFSNALPFTSNATVTPTMELDPLNGVNTWDLILISRHILGLEPLNTPYKLIAADANKSGTVTTFDIVELRKLILGTYQQLPNNSSWRFIDKAQVFTNPDNPFADVIKEDIQIVDIQQSLTAGDFVGAKVGDVDNSATPNNLVSTDDRTNGTLLFDVQDRKVTAGETIAVTFTADQVVKGYQYTLNLNGLKVETIEGSTMSDENFAVFTSTSLGGNSTSLGSTDAITTSWDAPTVFNGKASYTVTFTATKSGKLSEMLSVSSRITKAVAFASTSLGAGDCAKWDIGLRFNNGNSSTIAGQAFELYQNTPNPWVNKTQIGFYLPEATQATLTVYDATGRTLYTAQGDFGKGYNAFTIERASALLGTQSGALFYKVETSTDSGVKQMIQTK